MNPFQVPGGPGTVHPSTEPRGLRAPSDDMSLNPLYIWCNRQPGMGMHAAMPTGSDAYVFDFWVHFPAHRERIGIKSLTWGNEYMYKLFVFFNQEWVPLIDYTALCRQWNTYQRARELTMTWKDLFETTQYKDNGEAFTSAENRDFYLNETLPLRELCKYRGYKYNAIFSNDHPLNKWGDVVISSEQCPMTRVFLQVDANQHNVFRLKLQDGDKIRDYSTGRSWEEVLDFLRRFLDYSDGRYDAL